MLVSVYGTLKKNQSNHSRISKGKYVGSFETLPIYKFYSINDRFPALKSGGHTSVMMEVYDVTHEILSDIDSLEGYDKNNPENSHYIRKQIETPFGTSFVYMYNRPIKSQATEIHDNDWVDYISLKRIVKIN